MGQRISLACPLPNCRVIKLYPNDFDRLCMSGPGEVDTDHAPQSTVHQAIVNCDLAPQHDASALGQLHSCLQAATLVSAVRNGLWRDLASLHTAIREQFGVRCEDAEDGQAGAQR